MQKVLHALKGKRLLFTIAAGLFLFQGNLMAQSSQFFTATGGGYEFNMEFVRIQGDAEVDVYCTYVVNYTISNFGDETKYSSFRLRYSVDGGLTYINLVCETKKLPPPGETWGPYTSASFQAFCYAPVIIGVEAFTAAGNCGGTPAPFEITTGVVILPVRFSETNLRSLATGTEVSWAVSAGNENVRLFQVQYSKSGNDFATVGQVAGTNTARATNYAFQDLNVRERGFYRIAVIENDGGIYYSKTLFFNPQKAGGSFRIFPVPAKNQIFVERPAGNNAASEVMVFTLDGRQVLNSRLQGNSLDVSRLPNGSYILMLKEDAQTVYRQQFLIAR